jgi:hypothetical protein
MTKPKITVSGAANMAEQMAAYQKVMDDKIAQYNKLVEDAQRELGAIVKAANPPTQKPECEWTETEGGKYLVMNVAAAEFFQAIFEQVGVLANELAKQTKGK